MTVLTVSGDTWDSVARRVYGDERQCQALMEARENIKLLDIEVFSGGVAIYVPDAAPSTVYMDVPLWRR